MWASNCRSYFEPFISRYTCAYRCARVTLIDVMLLWIAYLKGALGAPFFPLML